MAMPNRAVAAPRLAGGKLSSRMACDNGCMAPPPSLAGRGQRTSIVMLVASPQSNEATVKIIVQPIKNRFRPKKLENHVLAGRMIALATR